MHFIERNFLQIKAVLTSTMRRGGRKERGLPDGLQLADYVNVLAVCRSDVTCLLVLTFLLASAAVP